MLHSNYFYSKIKSHCAPPSAKLWQPQVLVEVLAEVLEAVVVLDTATTDLMEALAAVRLQFPAEPVPVEAV